MSFKVGDRVKYHNVEEYGVIVRSYKSPNDTIYKVGWDAGYDTEFESNYIGNYLKVVQPAVPGNAIDILIAEEHESMTDPVNKVLPCVLQYDDHAYHIKCHNDYIKNNKLSYTAEMMIADHITEHVKMMQSAVPLSGFSQTVMPPLPYSPNIPQSTGNFIFNTSGTIQPRKEHRFDNSYQRDYECKPISCCSDHKNQEIYTNFYDKRVKYCKKCGNEIK